MKTLKLAFVALALFGLGFTTSAVKAQDYNRDYNDPDDYNNSSNDRGAIDRYLDVEVWTDHADADYYTGDEVVVNFRTNRDAFVAIYSIDSRGLVNLLFPSDPAQDNFVRGSMTYSLPGPDDDFELVLNGPEGSETIQIIASRERFPIPDWYRNSGLVFEGDDIYDYMDWLNGRHFVRYGGQRFAYDRAVIFVNEWEPNYFRPVYYDGYPSWSVVGNVYLDYYWGSSVYINGYYWGVTPLYIPRILVGWHTLTIYDRYGYCWESDFHVSRYHTTIFDHYTIVTSSTVRSKYKRVRSVGYRDPVSNGYANYNKTVTKFKTRSGGAGGKVVNKRGNSSDGTSERYVASKKRYVRGDAKLVKTERGYETRLATTSKSGSKSGRRSYSPDKSRTGTSSGSNDSYSSGKSSSGKSAGKSGNYSGSGKSSSSRSGSGDYYKRKSGKSSSSPKGNQGTYRKKAKTGSSSKTSKSPSKSPTIKQSKGSSKQSTSKGSEKKVTKSSTSKSGSSKSVGSSKSSKSSRSSGSSSKSSKSSSGGGKKRR